MIQWNLWMRLTPAAMKRARMMSAPRIPQNNTLCWWIAGTWKKRKIKRKTKRLSTLSESSMTYPVTNSSAGVRPCQKKITTAKIAARAIHAPLQANASRNFTVWARRWNTPRSSPSMERTKRVNTIQNSNNQRPRVREFAPLWGGHSCPPPLSLTLYPNLAFSPGKSTNQNLKSNSKIKFKGGGHECPPHTSIGSALSLFVRAYHFPSRPTCRRSSTGLPDGFREESVQSGRDGGAGREARERWRGRWSRRWLRPPVF